MYKVTEFYECALLKSVNTVSVSSEYITFPYR